MSEDAELLRRYAVEHSEAAFSEMIRRHVDLVYSAALRMVNGDTHRAQDVTQQVFAELARQAKRLMHHPAPAGWLYTTTRLAALRIIRTEQRRSVREQEATTMNEILRESAPEPDWADLRPVLEAAMHELGEKDRLAVLLRFFQNKTLKEVGTALGLGENAARMRVDRALEKLRAALVRHGVAATASLASVISANAVQLAPANFVATLTTASITTAGAGTFTLLKIMTATQLKFGLTAIVVAGLATALVVQHQTQARLRGELDPLRQQIAQLKAENEGLSRRAVEVKAPPHLPAPVMKMSTTALAQATEDLPATNIYTRFMDAPPKLTAAQVADFLQANRTNAASLLAAFRTSGDPGLLKAAMEKFPRDPQVAFEAALDKNLSPEEQRRWLTTFEQTAPDNALANYLSAFNYFNSGQIDQGIQEMSAATGKGMNDYTLNRAQADEEAYLSAGYSAAEAERISDSELMVAQLPQVKKLGVDLVDLAKAYGQAGDQSSAQAAFQMAINLGQRYTDPATDPMLISQLVGLAIQKIALGAMDPNSPYGENGLTVQDQLNQITQNRAAITQLTQQAIPWLPSMSDVDILNYENRRRAFGELSALQWVADKYGQK